MTTYAALFAIAIGCAAPATAPPANRVAQKATTTASVPPFGDITVADGDLVLMDHNNGDGRVHVMTISRDFHGSKVSWADRPGPHSDVNHDTFPISADERAQIQSWSQQIWELAPHGRRTFPRSDDAKPYEWAIVMRRGDDVRVVEGGASSEPQSDRIEAAVDFLDMHF